MGLLELCLSLYILVSLAIEQINGLYTYSIFKSLSIAGHFSVNINILATIDRDPSVGNQNKQCRFFRRGNFD